MKLTKTEKEFFTNLYQSQIKGKRKIEHIGIVGKRNHNILESAGFEIERNRKGDYNGYGYEKLPNAYIFKMADRPKWAKFIKAISKTAEKKEKISLTEEQITEKWAKRLAKLAGITLEEAKEIASENIAYKWQQIEIVNDRQYKSHSQKRQTLINKMERENPLRRIKDTHHAECIIAASDRHNRTNYENLLEEGRELAAIGDIDKSEVKDFARKNIQK